MYYLFFKKGQLYIEVVFLMCLFSFPVLLAQPLADGHSKFLGNIYGNDIPENFGSYWNQITPENAAKWGSVETTRDNYNWEGLNLGYNYALEHNIPFKLHTLVSGSQQPSFLAALDSINQLQEINEWMELLGERYPETDLVDVVTAPIVILPGDQYPTYYEALGGAGSTGWDWVIRSFELARQYLPNAKLVINENNILNNVKSLNTYLEIIHLLKERELIDAVSVVAHYLEDMDSTTLKKNLDSLATAGLPLYLSSYGVDLADDQEQLSVYQEQFPIFWKHPAVKGITFWGYIENETWITNYYLVRNNGTERPALAWMRTYLSARNTGKYRSHQSGDWHDVHTWEKFDGLNWISPVATIPDITDGQITIQNGDSVTVTEADSSDQLRIERGGSLIINQDVVFKINDGDGTDLEISGTIYNFGTVAPDEDVEIVVTNSGTYIHKQDGGAIPTAIWDIGSICQIDSVINNLPANSKQAFFHLVWNCPRQEIDLNMGWNGMETGHLTLESTGTSRFELCDPQSGSITSVSIMGDVHVNGGFLTASASDDAGTTVHIYQEGDLIITGGKFAISAGTQGETGTSTWYLHRGNLSIANADIIVSSSVPDCTRFHFTGDYIQEFILGEGNTIPALPIEVESSAILHMGSSVLTGSGFFIINPGATMATAHPEGLAGTIATTGKITLNRDACYAFNGDAAQVTSSLLPDMVYNLIIDNAAGVTLSNDVIIDGTLEIRQGTISLAAEAVLKYGADGTLKYADSYEQTTTDTEFPEDNGPHNIIIANTDGVTLHASQKIPGNLSFFAGKLYLDGDTLTATTTSGTGLDKYIVLLNSGAFTLVSIDASPKVMPIGTTLSYAPLWISKVGSMDTITAGVSENTTASPYGGRVKLDWDIHSSGFNNDEYTLTFGWTKRVEDSDFRKDRESNAKIFNMTDTTEAGSGPYTTYFDTEPHTVSRSGITKLGRFAVGIFTVTASDEVEAGTPYRYQLSQNYPNPFNSGTLIKYQLPVAGEVNLTVYNLLGQTVITLVSERKEAGIHLVEWHAEESASGIYIYGIKAGHFSARKKMLLLK